MVTFDCLSAPSAPQFPTCPLANPPLFLQQPHELHSLESCTEGASSILTELMWMLTAHPGPMCAKGMISLSSMCALPRTDTASFGMGDIGTMCHYVSMKPGEYSYFSPRTLSMWAGPEHWRFKPRHKRMYVETAAHVLPGPASLWAASHS